MQHLGDVCAVPRMSMTPTFLSNPCIHSAVSLSFAQILVHYVLPSPWAPSESKLLLRRHNIGPPRFVQQTMIILYTKLEHTLCIKAQEAHSCLACIRQSGPHSYHTWKNREIPIHCLLLHCSFRVKVVMSSTSLLV